MNGKSSIEERKQEVNQSRKRRTPLGTAQRKLDALVPEGKVGRWINDEPGRIEAAKSGGYEHLAEAGEQKGDDMGAHISRVVGKGPNGEPKRAYLMAIDRDLYEEDQKTKEYRISEHEGSIKRGVPSPESVVKNQYVPDSERKITQINTPRGV